VQTEQAQANSGSLPVLAGRVKLAEGLELHKSIAVLCLLLHLFLSAPNENDSWTGSACEKGSAGSHVFVLDRWTRNGWVQYMGTGRKVHWRV